MSIVQKPTKKEQKELKDFKLRVGIAMYNAIQLFENANSVEKIGWEFSKRVYPTLVAHVGNAVFTFKPDGDFTRETVDKLLKKFTTSRW